MSRARWTWLENPDFAGVKVRQLSGACHDGSPFLSIRCACGMDMHLHESQLDGVGHSRIRTLCKGCNQPLDFPPGWFPIGFAILREHGWIK